nr:hypothetical protein [Tanacetum cinerariifolium]
MMKSFDIGIQKKKAKLFNESERFTLTDGESIESYYHRFSKLMNDFKRNKHFLKKIASRLLNQNVGNQNGYNVIQNVRNQVVHNAFQNPADLDEIKEVNANCILMANLQQASTSGTQIDTQIDKAPVYDSDRSAE